MMASELFWQAALVNAVIFLWLASAISAMRILIRCDGQMSTALLLSVCFGPLAFVGAWLYEARAVKKMRAPSVTSGLRSWMGMLLVVFAMVPVFYALFMATYSVTNTSNELLLQNIVIFALVGGFLGGVLLSIFTLRVAFFECCWVTFFLSLFVLFLKDWSEEVFSYGTSLAYFITLLLTAFTLLLIALNLGGSVGYLMFGEGRLNLRCGYENFLGGRFFITKRSRHVVSLITIISEIAVMIACVGMIVVMSVMNGFSSDLRSKILGANAHLMVLKYGKDFTEYNRIIDQTKDIPGVISASAFVVNEGMVHSNRNIATSIITGIDLAHVSEAGRLKYVSEQALDYLRHPEKIPVVTEVRPGADDDLAKQNPNDLPGVIIGKEMASDLQVLVGDTVNLVSP